MSFYSGNLAVRGVYPTLNSVRWGPYTISPGPGAEDFDFEDSSAVDEEWDIGQTSIRVRFTETIRASDGAVNAWLITDLQDSLPDFARVSIVAARTTADFDASMISWNGERIVINYTRDGQGITVLDGQELFLRVAFDPMTGTAAADVLRGTAGNDRMNGKAGSDSLSGLAGNDVIRGEAGNDTLLGGAGSDTLYGGVGRDRLLGEAGNDLLLGGAGADTLYGGAGNDRVYGDAGNDVLSGGSGFDTLYGGAGADRLLGEAGDDELLGAAGNDTLLGGTGNDWLDGGAGNDILLGGAGNDALSGGAGRDVLTGGAGADSFFFTAPLAGSQDQITDFISGTDRITLDEEAFAGFSRYGQIRVSEFARGIAAADEGDRVIYHRASGRLWYDEDGTGAQAQVLLAELGAGTVLVAGDVFLS